MQLKNPAVAGTLESSDVQITLRPNPQGGIELSLESVVRAMFGDSIRETVLQVLREFQIEDALVEVNDKGALDHVIRSRMQAAVCRATGCRYDWSKED